MEYTSNYNLAKPEMTDTVAATIPLHSSNMDTIETALTTTTATIKGRKTAGTGTMENLSAGDVRTLLNVADGANAYVHPNHTGDVTSVADGATTIAAKAVTLAKMADMATASIIGRTTAAAGVPEVISKTDAKTLLDIDDLEKDLLTVPNTIRIDDLITEAGSVYIGGLPSSLWTPISTFTKGNTIMLPGYAFCQNGKVHTVKFMASTEATADVTFKFKVFRYNYSTALYDFIDERSATFATIVGEQKTYTVVLSTPINVLVGDIPAIYYTISGAGTMGLGLATGRSSIPDSRYVLATDVTTSNAFADDSSSAPMIECLGYNPLLAFTGDSIFEGHNCATHFDGRMHDAVITGGKTIPGGYLTSEPAYMTVSQHPTTIGYQNLALGSQTFAWVASTGAPACFAVNAHTVIILCGINDIVAARTWGDVNTDLDTIKTAFDLSNSTRLMICEILPCTNVTDAQAETIRTWNVNLATWCAANGATLIKTHDKLAKIRTTTRLLDDLRTEYDYDGVHLKEAGVEKLGEIIYEALLK